ncbi:Wzt carbohydrate-binding domain-containing protein [bacterium]|nr:Wzt carbohydrate-binding domain-containing protein [candidate division CSSED10-310 bacterium]
MKEAICFENISKKFTLHHEAEPTLKQSVISAVRREARIEEFWALKNISFTVQPGEVVGIIGKNGSGKSTLLRLAAGILSPDFGRVRLRGAIASFLDLGAGFHSDLNGRENVYLFGTLLGMPREEIDAAFDRIVAFAGLGRFIDVPIRNYSTGMVARLGFSIAANIDPDILLIDEILAVGDFVFQRKCYNKLEEFKKNNKTILMVSHSLGEVEELCTRAICLHRGEILVDADVDLALQQYLTAVKDEDEWTREILRRDTIIQARLREEREREQRRQERERLLLEIRNREKLQEARRRADTKKWKEEQDRMILAQERIMADLEKERQYLDSTRASLDEQRARVNQELEEGRTHFQVELAKLKDEMEQRLQRRFKELQDDFEHRKRQLGAGPGENEWLGTLKKTGRWGNRQLEITAVNLFGKDGQPTDQVDASAPLRIRMDFIAHDACLDPVFRLFLFRADGMFIYGNNTNRLGWRPGTLKGAGYLSITFDYLNLLKGDYLLSVSAWPDEHESFWNNTPFDIHNFTHRFTIQDHSRFGGGAIHLPCDWELRMENESVLRSRLD